MNIDDLTIGQARELVATFGNQQKSSITAPIVGEYVIVRSRNEGINFGQVVAADETGIVLKNARRVWRPVTKNGEPSWYEGVATIGLDPERGRISVAVSEKVIVENYSVTVCTEAAIKNLTGAKANESDF